MAYFLIFYMSKINFNKYKINKKNIESNLKSHLLFYFYKNILGAQNWVKTELSKKTHLYLLFQNFFLTQMKS